MKRPNDPSPRPTLGMFLVLPILLLIGLGMLGYRKLKGWLRRHAPGSVVFFWAVYVVSIVVYTLAMSGGR